MRNYYDDNDDPIKEVSEKSIFKRIKSFEENDEYDFEKEMKEYEKSISNRQQENTNVNNYQSIIPNRTFSDLIGLIVFCSIFILPFLYIIFGDFGMSNYTSYTRKDLPIKTSLGSDIPDLNDEYDKKIYYKLSSISFDRAGSIVALYEYDQQTKGNWCNFTESDERFNGIANTFQINYNYIPEYSKDELRNGLIARKFKHVVDYPTGSVYAINKSNGYCLFVLISKKDIIYGSGFCEYQDIFGE